MEHPLSGGRYASGAPLTPAPTPVAPLGDGETRDVPTAVKGLGQDPVYDPTEGASGSALPSAGNDQIDNPLFEEQQQQDISSTAFDQGTAFPNTSHVPFASPRQQEFYSTMYSSAASGIQRDSSSALSDTSLSSLDASEQHSTAQHESPLRNPQQSSFASMANPAFSDQPQLGTQQSPAASRQQPPSVAAASLGAFYQGPFFPRKTSLSLPTQQVESGPFSEAPTEGLSVTAEPFVTPVSVSDAPAYSSRPMLGGSQQQDETTLVSSAEAYAEEPASSAQQVEFARPLTIPTHSDLHDDEQQYYAQSAAASPAAAEPYSQAVQAQLLITEQCTLFADGPMFDGSPLASPVDVPAPQQASSTLPEPAALHSGPIFRDNPVFSDALEQEGSTPFTVRQAPSVASPASPVAAASPGFSSRPILGAFEQQADPPLPSVSAHQQPLLPQSQLPSFERSPAFASTPILGPHAQQPQQQQQTVPLIETPQASVEFSEPVTGATAFSSQPVFGRSQQQVHQPIPDATPVQDELPPSLTQDRLDHAPAFSNQPIFGVSAQQQEQVYTPVEVAMPVQQQPALTAAPAFSSKPLLGAYQQQEQQSLVDSPAQIATPMQEEPAVTLSEPVVTGQFSSTPIFGTQSQPQQQQQDIYTPLPSVAEPLQDPLYDPTQGRPAAVQFETPAAIASPRFQSRPIFGQQQQQAQQAQQVQVQSASADNPWANRDTLLAEREPSFALASSASPRQGINFYDNTLFESSDQPQILTDGITFQSSPPLSSQQPAYSSPAQQPAWQQTSAAPVEQGITFQSVSPFDAPQRSSPVTPVPVTSVPAPFLSSQPTLGMPALTDTAQLRTAQQDTAQRVHYSPASTFASPAPTRATPLTGGSPAFSDTPLLGGPGGVVTTPVTYIPAGAAQPTAVEEPLSDPLYDPAAQRAVRVPIAPARPAALLEPLDDPLYDPLQRRPVVAHSEVHQVKPMVLQPLEDPLYDPTLQRRPMIGQPPSAAPHGPRGSRFVSAQNSRFLQHVDDPLYDPAAVESAPGLQKDVTHRGEQVGTPTFARQQQQQPSAFGAAPTNDIITRPVMGSTRRPPRTVKLADIGRPAPLPPVQEQQYEAPEPKPEVELGGADVLPRDEHYVKPTPYDELGANARSALSGAGWKSKWSVEMEATAQRCGQGGPTAHMCARLMMTD